jgi:predicted O-linked N-acetylglucosamine transferase (SPINDLY family)
MSPQLQLSLQQAIKAFQSGNFDGADLILKRVLQVDSKNLPALHILGLIKASQSNFGEAADYLARAARIHPNDASIQYNLAKALTDSGDDKNALAHHKVAVALDPDNPQAWLNYGKTASNLARYEDALSCYNEALSLKSDYAEALLNKGATLKELKKYEDAIAFAEEALAINPNLAEAWSNKGGALKELKRYDDAIAHYDKALSLKPDHAETWWNKGVALKELKRYDDAIAHYDKALSLKPNHAEGWSNKGVALHELKLYDDAIAHYDKALSLKPNHAEGWSNKGAALQELKRYDEAIAHYNKALSLKPHIDWISGDLIHTKMKTCSWSDLSESLQDISKKLFASERVTNPFPLLALTDNSQLHKQSSEIFIKSKFPANAALGSFSSRLKNQKIRVGYFSADFHNHATGYLMAELFELHDKSQFEIVGFSFGPAANDAMRQRLLKSFDQFIEVGNKSDIEITQLSRNLNIDIAVDLKGITQESRTGIFASRAAPIQVNYLGYPGTLGANYIDYIIADKTLIPIESQSCYSEKVVYLPNSYQVNDRKRLISDKKFTRQELGLPEHGVVFCCFNNNYKILPEIFASWMRILKYVDGSVLWLFQANSWAADNLKKEAEKQGITPNRLVFAERVPLPEHLARHRQADLFLDTFPYNAHTTASDALWAGLPVLTLVGESFASRVAASLLNAIGLPELITSSQEEYEALAIELALNPKKLVDVKLSLANRRLIAPLFDTPLFTKNLEAAYIKMVEIYQADLEPDHIFFN